MKRFNLQKRAPTSIKAFGVQAFPGGILPNCKFTILDSYGDISQPHTPFLSIGHTPSEKDLDGPKFPELQQISEEYTKLLDAPYNLQARMDLVARRNEISFAINIDGGSRQWYFKHNLSNI